MKTKPGRKLTLNRESLRWLDPGQLRQVGAGVVTAPYSACESCFSNTKTQCTDHSGCTNTNGCTG